MVFPPTTLALHEIYARKTYDGVALCGVGLACAAQFSPARPILWVRQRMLDGEAGAPYAPGLAAHGLDPARLLLVRAQDGLSALQAGLEGARTPGLGAVLIELWQDQKAYDLTASRRLALAAKQAGTPVVMLGIGAEPRPSAAETRWHLHALPSQALATRAPGHPAFELRLLYARNRQDGACHLLEWDRNDHCFRPGSPGATLASARHATPLSGAVAPLPLDRPGARAEAPRRQAG